MTAIIKFHFTGVVVRGGLINYGRWPCGGLKAFGRALRKGTEGKQPVVSRHKFSVETFEPPQDSSFKNQPTKQKLLKRCSQVLHMCLLLLEMWERVGRLCSDGSELTPVHWRAIYLRSLWPVGQRAMEGFSFVFSFLPCVSCWECYPWESSYSMTLEGKIGPSGSMYMASTYSLYSQTLDLLIRYSSPR